MSTLLPEPYVEMPFGQDTWTAVRDALRKVQLNLEKLAAAASVPQGVLFGPAAGSPNGAVRASPGAIYLRRDGGAGATLYVKETGVNTNTGWVAK